MNPSSDLIALRLPAPPSSPDDDQLLAFDRYSEILRRQPPTAASLKMQADFARMRKPGSASYKTEAPVRPASEEWRDYREFVKQYFPELYRSREIGVLLDAGANPDVLFRPYHTWATVCLWNQKRERSERWGGYADLIGLLHLAETRRLDQQAEIAGLIETGKVTVVGGDKDDAIATLKGALDSAPVEADPWPRVEGFSEKKPDALPPNDRLFGSKEILGVLGLKGRSWKKFAKWAQTTKDCPIIFGGLRRPPTADRTPLLEWAKRELPNFGKTQGDNDVPTPPKKPREKKPPKPGETYFEGDSKGLTVKRPPRSKP
ncbi:MAG: hypothetical protein AAB074_20125 [Planctomycetota bacterium]